MRQLSINIDHTHKIRTVPWPLKARTRAVANVSVQKTSILCRGMIPLSIHIKKVKIVHCHLGQLNWPVSQINLQRIMFS